MHVYFERYNSIMFKINMDAIYKDSSLEQMKIINLTTSFVVAAVVLLF